MIRTLLNILLGIIILPHTSIHAQEKTESSILVDNTVKLVQKTVEEKADKISADELDKILRDQITPVFDFQEMSKRCLGVNWKKATPEEQKEFQSLFSNLLAKNYIKQIREKAKGSIFKLQSASETGEKALVQTMVTTNNGDLKIDYRLYKLADKWHVYDVIIENIGLISNYRSEFSDIVGKEGMQGLLVRLREK